MAKQARAWCVACAQEGHDASGYSVPWQHTGEAAAVKMQRNQRVADRRNKPRQCLPVSNTSMLPTDMHVQPSGLVKPWPKPWGWIKHNGCGGGGQNSKYGTACQGGMNTNGGMTCQKGTFGEYE